MEYLQALHSEPAVFDIEALSPVVEASGVWINDTHGQTRLALTRDGRYNKTEGLRQSTYSGHYSCKGNTIRFIDDFDFVLTGEINGNVMRIGKYVYRRGGGGTRLEELGPG